MGDCGSGRQQTHPDAACGVAEKSPATLEWLYPILGDAGKTNEYIVPPTLGTRSGVLGAIAMAIAEQRV